MQETSHKGFEQPEETGDFPNGEAQIVSIGGAPGDVTSLPSGHDAWVVGDEPPFVDWYGASNYAKAS